MGTSVRQYLPFNVVPSFTDLDGSNFAYPFCSCHVMQNGPGNSGRFFVLGFPSPLGRRCEKPALECLEPISVWEVTDFAIVIPAKAGIQRL